MTLGTMTSKTTFENLLNEVNRIGYLQQIENLLGWDEWVNLPSKSAQQRAHQKAVLAEILLHEKTKPSLGKQLQKLQDQQDSLTHEEKTIFKETEKEYHRLSKIPLEFVSLKTKTQSEAYHAWTQARKKSDFSIYAPLLQKNLELSIEEASLVGSHLNPYDYWIDQFDPHTTQAIIDPLFEGLKKNILPILDTILGAPNRPDPKILKNFSIIKQAQFAHTVAEKLGLDFNCARLDISLHPFCGGNGGDTRITTRYEESKPLESIFSTIHETGHALYEQGLPKKHLTNPLGQAIGMGMHESQSRLWENQIGRSLAFWEFWQPIYFDLFKDELNNISNEIFYRLVNAVSINPIRVESDEVTYNLHIILRYEIERGLFNKDFKVRDLPEVWNMKMKDLTGYTPKNDSEGVLQDIHWAFGFGYFPSYTLGNLIAAQLWETLQQEIPQHKAQLEKGHYSEILNWLRNHIHRWGRQYTTYEVLKQITGQKLAYEPLIAYLKNRYLPLYA